MTGPRGSDSPEFEPLGRKIDYPEPEQPEWVPTDTKGIERSTKTGNLRTAVPLYDNANKPFWIPKP
jgi:hypothetical protein